MFIACRVDSNEIVGTGHLMRCINLLTVLEGDKLILTNSDIISPYPFINLHSNGLIDDINKTIAILKTRKPDIFIIDNYEISVQWEKEVKPYCKKLVVIDDLNRTHVCDILINQNIGAENKYTDLQCIKLLGCKYVIFNQNIRKYYPRFRHRIISILISFGGSDPEHNTLKVIQQIEWSNIIYFIVVGQYNTDYAEIKRATLEKSNCIVYNSLSQVDFYNLMDIVDLSIGSCGTTSYERCYLGLPSIVITTIDNQQEISTKLEEIGCIKKINNVFEIKNIIQTIDVAHMSENCLQLVDYKGTERIKENLLYV